MRLGLCLQVPVAGLLTGTLCALWRMVHAKPDPDLLSVLDGGRAGSKRILLLPLIFGSGVNSENPHVWAPKIGGGGGSFDPRPERRGFQV